MAKNWSGFGPQNELVKLYWEALEASHSERVRQFLSFTPKSQSDKESAEDEPSPVLAPGFIPFR